MIKTNNNLKTKELYQANKDFDSNYNTNKYNYYDFTVGMHRYYGIADLNKNLLIPNEGKIVYDSKFKIFAFDFVISQYTDLVARYVSLQQSAGYINSDKVIFNCLLKPINIYNSPDVLFSNKATTLKDNYIKNYVINKLQYSNVTDFYSFLDVFTSDLLQTNTTQNTISEVILTNSYGGVNTGLGIALKKPDFSNDQEKLDFYNNVNFSFFRLMAEEYGFYIDSNNPYVLISNLVSKNTLKYLKAISPTKDYSKIDFILDDCYDVVLQKDFDTYKVQMQDLYSKFVKIYPYVSKYDKCGNETKVFLQPMPFSMLNDRMLLPHYFRYKNVNLGKYDAFQIEQHIKQVNIKSAIDIHKALVYIYDTIYLWQINEQLIKKPSQKI